MEAPTLWKHIGARGAAHTLRSPTQIAKAIKAGADPNCVNGNALMYATQNGTAEQVKALLDGGASVKRLDTFTNSPDFDMQKSLIAGSVCSSEGAQKLTYLRQAGVDIARKDSDGKSGLDYLRDRHTHDNNGQRDLTGSQVSATANVLMDAGYVPGGKDLFTLARFEAGYSTISRAIHNGADVNSVDNGGETALFYANNEEVAQCLLDHGADPNHQEKGGRTADQCSSTFAIHEFLERARSRHNLISVAQNARPSNDLATPEEALTRRNRGRCM